MTNRRFIAALLALAAVALGILPAWAIPGLNDRVVSDPDTGIALYGYDPVAYFTEGRPTPGRRDIEAEWNGAAWRFESEANRAAFLSAPETYAPRYGGYDPSAVARGAPAAGHPLLFKVAGDRLYLFHDAQDLADFADFKAADVAWPELEQKLSD